MSAARQKMVEYYERQARTEGWQLSARIPFEPYAVVVVRRCHAAENGGCNCTGACMEPIPSAVKEAALIKALDIFNKELTP